MRLLRFIPAVLLVLALRLAVAQSAEAQAPARSGLTLHVSKLGDNSDGRSWRTAFHAIQAVLDAIPDDRGGHRILIRPDTCAEANLDAKHKGAPGAYNSLEGDWIRATGSGLQPPRRARN